MHHSVKHGITVVKIPFPCSHCLYFLGFLSLQPCISASHFSLTPCQDFKVNKTSASCPSSPAYPPEHHYWSPCLGCRSFFSAAASSIFLTVSWSSAYSSLSMPAPLAGLLLCSVAWLPGQTTSQMKTHRGGDRSGSGRTARVASVFILSACCFMIYFISRRGRGQQFYQLVEGGRLQKQRPTSTSWRRSIAPSRVSVIHPNPSALAQSSLAPRILCVA